MDSELDTKLPKTNLPASPAFDIQKREEFVNGLLSRNQGATAQIQRWVVGINDLSPSGGHTPDESGNVPAENIEYEIQNKFSLASVGPSIIQNRGENVTLDDVRTLQEIAIAAIARKYPEKIDFLQKLSQSTLNWDMEQTANNDFFDSLTRINKG